MAVDTAIPTRGLPHAPADLEVTVGTPKWPLLQTIQINLELYQTTLQSIFALQHCLYVEPIIFLAKTAEYCLTTNC